MMKYDSSYYAWLSSTWRAAALVCRANANGMTIFKTAVWFGWSDMVSRAETSKMAGVFAKKVLGKTMQTKTITQCTFDDIDTVSATLQSNIISACRLWLVRGYSSIRWGLFGVNFGPLDTVTVWHLQTIITRMDKTYIPIVDPKTLMTRLDVLDVLYTMMIK
jgi:hypothetical protein